MRKITLFGLLLLPFLAGAQAFQVNKFYLSGGYGVGTVTGIIFKFLDNNTDITTQKIGPYYLKGEYAVAPHIGVGVHFAYMKNSASWQQYEIDTFGQQYTFRPKITRTTYSALFRFNYHFGENEHFDPYIGLGLGYRYAGWRISANDPFSKYIPSIPTNFIPIGADFTLGFRYMVTPQFGFYAEAGAAKSALQFGLTAGF